MYFSYVMFPPVAEKSDKDYFINDSPRNIIEQGRAYDAPWVAGVVSEEGLYITAGWLFDFERYFRFHLTITHFSRFRLERRNGRTYR